MAAEVETMFYVGDGVRNVPWHGLGTSVIEAPNSNEALIVAGLDWNVVQKDVHVDNRVVPDLIANVRDSDNKVLGIVSNRYEIVQNKQAFSFTDALLEEADVRYETAGSLRGGKTIWLLAKLPSKNILGDEVNNYVCFTNTHDGTGSVKAFETPVRVVCANTLAMALNSAKRTWSTRHIGDINGKLEEARMTLNLANKYMTALEEEADRLANTRVNDEKIQEWINELFPMPADNATDRIKSNIVYCRNEFVKCLDAPDITQFKNTAWGFVNAASDFVGHTAPLRMTKQYSENNWSKIMSGHPVFDKAYSLVKAA